MKNSIPISIIKRRSALSVSFAIIAILLVSLVALADWTSINTDDDQIDPNWASVTPAYEDDTNDAGIQDKDEIKVAKYVFDGDAIYFFMESWDATDILSSDEMRAVAALDCNNNGTFDDADDYQQGTKGDRIIVRYNYDQVIVYDGSGKNSIAGDPTWGDPGDNNAGGSGGAWQNPQTEWKAPLQNLYPECRGIKSPVPLAFSIIQVTDSDSTVISQSDGTYLIDNPIDFGDAKNVITWYWGSPTCHDYNTKILCSGPRHGISGLKLGEIIDADSGELANDAAQADDSHYNGDPNDEDGIAPTEAITWTAAGAGSLDVTVSGGGGYLNCWIDWDRSETFDSGEHLISEQFLTAGDHTLSVSVPAGVTFDGPYMARCRLTPGSGQGNTPTGSVWGGEVEDHDWLIQPVTPAISISGADVALSWTHLTQNDEEQAYKSAAPYFDVTAATAVGAANTTGSATDAGVVGTPSDVIFYKVVGHKTITDSEDSSITYTLTSTPSKELGLFEFDLIPGSNN